MNKKQLIFIIIVLTILIFYLYLLSLAFHPKELNSCEYDKTEIIKANCSNECGGSNFTHFDVINPYTNNSIWSKSVIIGCCVHFGFCDCKDYNKYEYIGGSIKPLK